MLGPYIAALIFGGVLLAMSLFGGHDDADADVDADADADGGLDLSGDGHADLDLDADADGDIAHGGHEAAGAIGGFLSTFASLRFWTFFMAFGGGIGLVLTLLGLPPVVTAMAAVTVGAVSGGFAVWTFRFLGKHGLSSSLSADDWVGRTARVTVPVSPERPGKVRLELDNEVKELIAVAAGSSESPMGIGDEVLIVELAGGVAKVTPNRPGAEPAARHARAAKT